MFYQTFFKKRNEILQGKNTDNQSNKFYLSSFVNYVQNEFLPYYPLWSGILIERFDIRRYSNATVESWNKIIKCFVFDGIMRQIIPRAISTLLENIVNRIIKRNYDWRTSRQRRNNLLKKLEDATDH